MNAKTSTKSLIYRTASILTILMMLFAALPAVPAGAVSLNIASIASGTWEATAWPNTLRSGTITVTAGDVNVVGSGTAFLTELSVGNILRTTTDLQIGTVASITSDTALTLTNLPATTRTDIAYHVQGVGPADNVTIANTHNVTIAANPVVQTGTVTVDAGGTLTVDDPGTTFSTLTVNGTVEATIGHDFGELIINNGGVVNAGTNGSYTASSLTINSGGTANVSRDLTVDSTTVIAGTISFSSTTTTARNMNFLGAVTLNSGAAWNEATVGNGANNDYNFHSNFTNNASVFVTSDTSIHSFVGSGKTISGSTNTAIARVTVVGTYTNNGILSVGHTLTGTGALTNGAAGTLNLGGIVSITTLANAGTATKSGAGPISTSLANFTNTGTLNLTGTGTISGITNNAGGIVNLESSGTITAFDNATATSVLNISDLTPPTITTLTVSVAGNTVCCIALAGAFTACQVEGGHCHAANGHCHRCRSIGHVRDSQLGIQVHIVVPGQPVDIVQLVRGQTHHLGEAGVHAVDLVDHALRGNDIHIAFDFHGTVVDPRKALALADSGCQSEGATGHFLASDIYPGDRRREIDGEGLLRLCRRLEVCIPCLVGIDHTGANGVEGDYAPTDRADRGGGCIDR